MKWDCGTYQNSFKKKKQYCVWGVKVAAFRGDGRLIFLFKERDFCVALERTSTRKRLEELGAQPAAEVWRPLGYSEMGLPGALSWLFRL